jgi:hypothetical protein
MHKNQQRDRRYLKKPRKCDTTNGLYNSLIIDPKEMEICKLPKKEFKIDTSIKSGKKLCIVVYACNLSIWETEKNKTTNKQNKKKEKIHGHNEKQQIQ